MGHMLDQIEALTDAQLELEGIYDYANKYINLVGKNIPKNKWRVVLKWSTKVTDNCVIEEQKILERQEKLNRLHKNMSDDLM